MLLERIKLALKNPSKIIVKILHETARIWSDKLYLQLLYRFEMGKKLDLKNPKSFCEKLQWLKLYNRCPEYTIMVDKYAVKRYVADKIGDKYIIPTLGVWERIDDIDWKNLPNQFVLKTTHGGGGGGVIICRDKIKFNKQEACKKLEHSMKHSIYVKLREWPYKNVHKRIIAEKFISDKGNADLVDYKFYCFDGKPTYCQVIRDRKTNETIDFYDMQWKHMPFVGLNPNVSNGSTPVAKPVHLDTMIDICRELSKNIPFSRIDLYIVNNVIYFGEITFYPASGIGAFTPKEWDYKLGDLINLS